jgi:hypothetical protein
MVTNRWVYIARLQDGRKWWTRGETLRKAVEAAETASLSTVVKIRRATQAECFTYLGHPPAKAKRAR